MAHFTHVLRTTARTGVLRIVCFLLGLGFWNETRDVACVVTGMGNTVFGPYFLGMVYGLTHLLAADWQLESACRME